MNGSSWKTLDLTILHGLKEARLQLGEFLEKRFLHKDSPRHFIKQSASTRQQDKHGKNIKPKMHHKTEMKNIT